MREFRATGRHLAAFGVLVTDAPPAGMLCGMIDLRGKVARYGVVVAAGALLLAGCGSDEHAGHGNSAPPTTAHEQLLLTPEQFPQGSKKLDLPKDKVQSAAADFASLNDSATFTPPECAQTQNSVGAATQQVIGDSTFIAASDAAAGVMYVEYLSPRLAELDRITEGNRTCGEVTLTTTVEGQSIESTVKVENKTPPAALDGIDAIVYRSTTVSSVGTGKPITMTDYMGIATLRGLSVAVRVSALDDKGDEDGFTKVFTDAVTKVRDAA